MGECIQYRQIIYTLFLVVLRKSINSTKAILRINPKIKPKIINITRCDSIKDDLIALTIEVWLVVC